MVSPLVCTLNGWFVFVWFDGPALFACLWVCLWFCFSGRIKHAPNLGHHFVSPSSPSSLREIGPFTIPRKRAEYCFESTASTRENSLSFGANSVSSAKNSVSSLWHTNNRLRGTH